MYFTYIYISKLQRIMKERDMNIQKANEPFRFKSIETYVRNYAKNCRLSYLSLLNI